MPKTPIREQKPQDRIKNFNEVMLGYTEEEARKEASRCLNCKKPTCVAGCPVEINIPGFIKLVEEGKFEEAARLIKEKNNLPAVCGRVCPQELQCEKVCVLSRKDQPVAIGRLEKFVADWELEHMKAHEMAKLPKSGKKVAVIGSGPASLTCSGDLAKMGHDVTMFESLHAPGGVLVYGIPEFRLPKRIVAAEIEGIHRLGVEIKLNVLIGRTKTIQQLREEGYEAFFIGTGAGLPWFMDIEGEDYNGVYSANEFLTRINLMKAYLFPEYDTPVVVGKRVAVIGAGNVAFDSARCALRMGAEEVYIVYRRTEDEMPARTEEIEHAKEEGIKFMLLTNPTRIIGDDKGWVKQMVCIKNQLGEPDDSGRPRPVPIPGSEFTLDFDTIVCAIGNGPNPLLLSTIQGLELSKRGNVIVNNEFRTSIEDIFAGGDIHTGSATVIAAMGAGKQAARSIHKYLS